MKECTVEKTNVRIVLSGVLKRTKCKYFQNIRAFTMAKREN